MKPTTDAQLDEEIRRRIENEQIAEKAMLEEAARTSGRRKEASSIHTDAVDCPIHPDEVFLVDKRTYRIKEACVKCLAEGEDLALSVSA